MSVATKRGEESRISTTEHVVSSSAESHHDNVQNVPVTPKKKRHIIKAKNLKSTSKDGTVKNSPLAKSMDFIQRLSKRNNSRRETGNSKDRKGSEVGSDNEKDPVVQNFYTETPLTGHVKPEILSTDDKSEAHVSEVREAMKGSSGEPQEELQTSEVNSLHQIKPTIKSERSKSGRKKPKKVLVKSHVLTEYYPVRRSSRKTKSLIEKEENDVIFNAIKSKCEDGLSVVEFNQKGRGVVAKRAFKKGSFIVEYAGDLVSWTEAKQREEVYSKDPTVGCYMYYFVYNNTNYCVDATSESGRLGRLLNHSRKNPNCKTRLVPMDNPNGKGTIPILIIVAKRDINAGEELTYDYGDKDKETLQSHPWLKST